MNKVLYEQLVAYILENQNRFYRLAYSYTKNQEDALDAVQNAVCKALESFESIRNTGAIKTWFYRILINESLHIIQKRKKEAASSDLEDVDMVYHEKAYDQESVEEELDQLEPDVQEIIRLRFFEEMSLKEISSITGYNLSTVKTKLYRGLKLLRENIQEAAL
ncbi:MAG: sigma-70 family RNA polymerase sigma factor [Firmicutes bacterium]|nr:sigma-70 family RNA polymerase sigma factor [Bacillota bacterium]